MKNTANADSLVDKIMSCARIKPTNLNTLFWDGVETVFYCQTLLNNCATKTQLFHSFILYYLTLLVYL